jgi:hypothetical protein
MKNGESETRLQERLSKSCSAFRQGSGTPPWLVSETTTDMFIDQSDKWVNLLPAIGFGQTLCFFQGSPEFEQFSSEKITEESRAWAEYYQIRDALLAAYGLFTSVNELWLQGKLDCPTAVVKTLPVLVAMFWCYEGSRMIPETVRILGCSQATPAGVFDSYRAAMESGDEYVLFRLEELIDHDPVFGTWTNEFLTAVVRIDVPERPLPLPYAGLAPPILLTMLETEVKVDHN